MKTSYSYLASMSGSGPPVFAFLFFTGVVIYQLYSGALLTSASKSWWNRSERPVLYWTVVALETAFCLFGYLGMFLL